MNDPGAAVHCRLQLLQDAYFYELRERSHLPEVVKRWKLGVGLTKPHSRCKNGVGSEREEDHLWENIFVCIWGSDRMDDCIWEAVHALGFVFGRTPDCLLLLNKEGTECF